MTAVKRGDVFLVDFSPARGGEQAGLRPALVIQNDMGNRAGATTIVIAITTAITKPYPFLALPAAGEGGLEKDSAVNAAQILTIDQTRLVQKLGSVTEDKMRDVERAVCISLGLG